MKKILTSLACLAMVITLVACGSSGGKKSGTLIVGAEKLTGNFSPAYYSSSYDGYVVDLVYDKLMTYDKDNKQIPALAAAAPKVSEDGKTVTYKLRKNVKFSDGTDFTAEDVEFTTLVIADPAYTGRYGAQVKFIEGYEAYASKEAKELKGVKVIDKHTISFTFAEGRTDNLYYMASTGILSKDSFKDFKQGDAKKVEEAAGKPVGTGPYTLKSWKAATGAVFEKNKNYWGDGYEIEKVIIKPVEMSTDYQVLKSGEIDYLPQMIEPAKIEPAAKNKDLELNAFPRAGMGYISFNTQNGATKDVAVRQALTRAFDRQSFVSSYFALKDVKDYKTGGYVPQTFQNPASNLGPIVRNEKTIEGLDPYKYDMAAAAKELDAAGWVKGADGIREKNGEKLTLKVLSMKDHAILDTLIPMWKSDWGEGLGVDIQVATLDFNTILDKLQSDAGLSEWNVFFLANSWVINGNGDIYSKFHSSDAREGGDNYARLSDPELDSMLDNAGKEFDEEKSEDLYKKIAIKLNDAAAIIPVYGNTYFDLYNKKVKNLKTNSLYMWTEALKDASIK